MDKLASVIAAVEAGKLPTQSQISNYIDYTLTHIVTPLEEGDSSRLSEYGSILAQDLREVLLAYKNLGTNKNYDNLVQETLWRLQESNFSDVRVELVSSEETATDLDAFRSSIRTLIRILWENISGEGTNLLNDFASFSRIALSDLAEIVESQAAYAKESLRELDTQVQQGERDNLGRRKRTQEEIEQEEAEDAKVRFEKTMDTVKESGSKAIGTAQSAHETVKGTSERATTRLRDAYFRMIERAQGDAEYKRALTTLFKMAAKWVNKVVDTAGDMDQATKLETFVEDPTEEKHLHQALYNLRVLIERLASGQSVDNLFTYFRECAVDVKQEEDVKAWCNDMFVFVHKCLGEPKYAHTDDATEAYDNLRRRWKELLNEDSDAARKWKDDVKNLRREIRALQQAIRKDTDIVHVRRAHEKWCNDLQTVGATAGKIGVQFALEQGSWFWQDMFNVYMPRLLRAVKDIPIPRTEYVDPEVDFVLENLDISSLSLLPGHVYIRNITDVDITAPAEESTRTAWGTLTHVRMQALQLTLKEVSFYYKDKVSTMGPTEFTGIMEFNLPTQGLDVDIKFRLTPNTPLGLKERERAQRFFRLERVDVHLAENITFEVKKSNHPVLATVFKPVLVSRFREALERTLEEQIRGVFDMVDGISFDISNRAEVFEDTGLGRGAAMAAAIWSEIGRMRRMESGLLGGWKATGTGLVKENLPGDAQLAMGAEPQILPGEKRGPLGTFAVPISERPEFQGIVEGRVSVAETVKQATREGTREVQSFRETVRRKALEERRQSGWNSHAFDLGA
ncbi:hypothetical protein EDC04DRAFT_3140724 [Pisolithus marmoratus]|nr:hypothetical protein EDC04DRAFT_3140724 [Pisolithus marmoratus]